MNSERRRSLVRENLVIAWDVLSSHKLRSGLIILGVCIGVAALMGMVSILAGLGEKITRDINRSEQTVLMLVKFDIFVGGFDEAMLHRKDITEEDARFIKSLGLNLVRIPVNYRHFEDDMNPFAIKQGGFKLGVSFLPVVFRRLLIGSPHASSYVDGSE